MRYSQFVFSGFALHSSRIFNILKFIYFALNPRKHVSMLLRSFA